MARFVTIGYGDEAGYRRTPQRIRDAAHASDEKLQREGALVGMAGKPVQVRNPDGGGVQSTDGAYLSAQLPVAGFAIIEAESLEEAIRMVSGSPCAVCNGVVEVWPLVENSD
jgi:hypothetical protein